MTFVLRWESQKENSWYLDSFIPKAAGRRLEDTFDPDSEDWYGTNETVASIQSSKDCRNEVTLKPDHETRPLWVTSGLLLAFEGADEDLINKT